MTDEDFPPVALAVSAQSSAAFGAWIGFDFVLIVPRDERCKISGGEGMCAARPGSAQRAIVPKAEMMGGEVLAARASMRVLAWDRARFGSASRSVKWPILRPYRAFSLP